jgi:ATP-dependent DNA helicase RecG
LGIYTYQDLLYYFPYRYLDRTKEYTIREISNEQTFIQLKGVIVQKQILGEGRVKRMVASFRDKNGEVIDLVWFNAVKWASAYLELNKEYVVFGHPNLFNGRFSFNHPDIEPVELNQSQVVSKSFMPLYNTTEKARTKGFDNKSIGKLVMILLSQLKGTIPEIFPSEILASKKLLGREDAFLNIHFPESMEIIAKAQYRLKFEELFFNQLKLLFLKLIRVGKSQGFVFSTVGESFLDFYNHHLPFELTGAQKRVVKANK